MLPLIALPVASTGNQARITQRQLDNLVAGVDVARKNGRMSRMYDLLAELGELSSQDERIQKYIAKALKEIDVHCKGNTPVSNCNYRPGRDWSWLF